MQSDCLQYYSRMLEQCQKSRTCPLELSSGPLPYCRHVILQPSYSMDGRHKNEIVEGDKVLRRTVDKWSKVVLKAIWLNSYIAQY